MDESKFLDNFAKMLGPAGEKALKDLEEKKQKEKKYLDSLASALGPEAKKALEELEEKQAAKKAEDERILAEKREEARIKKEKEQKLLEQLNKSLSSLVSNNPEYAAVIEQEVQQTVAEVQAEIPAEVVEQIEVVAETTEQPTEAIEENAAQPQPELPKDDIITRAVKDISKAAPGKIQQVVDEVPDSVRKELNILKKSIADLHRFATNHSQLGGGGEVKLSRLDDVDFTTAEDGYYLKYDLASGKFIFDQPTGTGGGGFTNGQSISVNTAVITYSLVPSTNNQIDIGTNELRFRTLYLTGNTIVLGNSIISAAGNTVTLPAGSTVAGQPISTGASLIYDGGSPSTDFSVGLSLDCGGVS